MFDPPSAVVGHQDFTLRFIGNTFIIAAADFATADEVEAKVVNPAPGNKESHPRTFNVTAPV